MKVGFVSLGCSKNLIDTEMTIGLFKKHKFEIVNTAENADIIVINTCGFIESAKEEAINTILEMAEYKKENCKYLIVMGCLVERYKEDLEKAIPEVDLWIKFSMYDELWDKISNLINKEKDKKDNLDFMNRVVTTGKNYAYLRIADGCDNFCTFCAIPYIRGRFKSRKIEDILQEAKKLADEGYHEIILIAQDTSKYGIDIYGKPKLSELLKKLCKIEKISWIRFLYTYPETITDELIQTVKNEEKICSYFDIPIQHISNPILKKMNRKSDEKSIKDLIKKLRDQIPDVIIRSTLMVGFPGETQKDFEKLYDFVKWAKFDKLGAFTYSKEEPTAAAKMPNQIHPMTKKGRYNKIMKIQKEISEENLKKQIGRKLEAYIDGKSIDKKYYIARSYMDVPEIDGVIYIKIEDKNIDLTGKKVICNIIDVKEYDLIGKIEK